MSTTASPTMTGGAAVAPHRRESNHIHPFATQPPPRINRPRQDEVTDDDSTPTTSTNFFPTSSEINTASGDGDAGPSRTTSVDDHQWITTSELTVQTSPVPLAQTIGLIMPNPWQKIYVEMEYRLGFVDAVKRPAPTIGGWMRQVTPILVLPDYSLNVFSRSGPSGTEDPAAVPPQSPGLCGARIEDDPVQYPFIFHRPGWYMLVINQTWLQPTISQDEICRLPITSQKSFFATQLFSVAVLPTGGAMPAFPGPPQTLFAEVTVETPGSLPIDPHVMTSGQRLGLALGATLGVLGLIGAIFLIWWANRRTRRKRETEAFYRLKPHEQAAFINDNPTHFLNPNRDEYIRGQRGAARGYDMWGRQLPWWSRWGQGANVNNGYQQDMRQWQAPSWQHPAGWYK